MTSPKKLTGAKSVKQDQSPKRSIGQRAAGSITVVEKTLRNSPVFISLIIFTALLYFAVIFLNLLAGDPNIIPGLFERGISEVSNEFNTKITPAGWAFSIWGLIYLFQFAWIIYSLALICRTTPNGPAYLNPIVLSPAFFIFFNLSSAFNIGWLFLWDRILFMASFVFLGCITLSLFLTLAIASVRLVSFQDTLVDQGRTNDVNFLKVAVVNGVGMYATWSTVATLVNLVVVLTYKWRHPIGDEKAAIICLGILSFFTVIYIALDMTVLEQYTRFAFAPYLVIIWALVAIVVKNYNKAYLSSTMSVVLLGSVCFACLVKIALTSYRVRSVRYHYRQMKRGRPTNLEQ